MTGGTDQGTRGDPSSDADLVAASVAAPDLFGEIFDRHVVTIHRYVARRLGASEAEEVTSETFRIAFEQRQRFVDERGGSARPWLYGIASNLIRRRHRSESRRMAALERIGPDRVGLDPEALVDDALVAKAAAQRLPHAIASLDPAEREVLLLVAWEEMTEAQVADALGIPRGTVKSRLHRARRKLREHLEVAGHQGLTTTHDRTGERSRS